VRACVFETCHKCLVLFCIVAGGTPWTDRLQLNSSCCLATPSARSSFATAPVGLPALACLKQLFNFKFLSLVLHAAPSCETKWQNFVRFERHYLSIRNCQSRLCAYRSNDSINELPCRLDCKPPECYAEYARRVPIWPWICQR
jgi:hypothetical protein